MRTTSLSSSKHVKIGWLLRSHPTYTNFRKVTEDLKARIGQKVEIELSPHTISHSTSKNTTIRTQALKVVMILENNKVVLEGLIEALTETPDEFSVSSTAVFKLIPFQNHAIGRDRLTKLIKR